MPPRNGSSNPRSLLVIKPSSLGDIVHGLQVIQSVAGRLPECRITWVVRDRFSGLVEAAPFVHEVIHFHRKNGFRGVIDVMKTLRARRFDVVWDMQGLLRSGLMAGAARSPEKRGRNDSREGAGLFSKKSLCLRVPVRIMRSRCSRSSRKRWASTNLLDPPCN